MSNAASAAAGADVQVISLNALKRGADNNYHKLEIPVALAKPAAQPPLNAKFCALRVDSLAFNSNC